MAKPPLRSRRREIFSVCPVRQWIVVTLIKLLKVASSKNWNCQDKYGPLITLEIDTTVEITNYSRTEPTFWKRILS